MWRSFIDIILTDVPVQEFSKPEGLVDAEVCLDSGLLATSDCPYEGVVRDKFWWDKVPEQRCDKHKKPDQLSTP
jgi:penicillin-binding protein 1A